MVEKADKAVDSSKRKQSEVEGAKEDVARGGRECQGMEQELVEIQKRRDKVSHGCDQALTSGNGERRKSSGHDRCC